VARLATRDKPRANNVENRGITTMNIMQVKRGDIVRFKAYSLRVEAEPILQPGAIVLHGRISVDGSPLVTKRFNASVEVRVDRAN
jgi:hypothetical protein